MLTEFSGRRVKIVPKFPREQSSSNVAECSRRPSGPKSIRGCRRIGIYHRPPYGATHVLLTCRMTAVKFGPNRAKRHPNLRVTCSAEFEVKPGMALDAV